MLTGGHLMQFMQFFDDNKNLQTCYISWQYYF